MRAAFDEMGNFRDNNVLMGAVVTLTRAYRCSEVARKCSIHLRNLRHS